MSERGSRAPASSCRLCGRATYDPERGERSWARGVAGHAVALTCPSCQSSRPAWEDGLDRCEACGSTRLSLALGIVTCRACGATQGSRPEFDLGIDTVWGA